VNNNLQRRQTLGLLAMGMVSSSTLLQACDRAPATIKIGVAYPLSGLQAPQGQDMLNGVTLAVEELNKEGLKVGSRTAAFEIVPGDDKASPDTGKEVAQRLVDAGVVAVIGHFSSSISVPVAPIYAQHDIAQLAISTNPKFTALGLSTTFRLVANDDMQAKAISSFCSSKFTTSTRYAIVNDGSNYGKDLCAAVASQLKTAKKDVVVQQSYDDKTEMFDELAARLKSDNAEVIVCALQDHQILALLGALKKVDYTKVNLIGSDSIKTVRTLQGANMVSGLYATSQVIGPLEFIGGKEFVRKFGKRFGVQPDYGAHYTYDAMYVLAAAMHNAKSAKPADIVRELKKIDGYAPVTQSMKWDAVGEQRFGMVGVYAARPDAWELLERASYT